MSAPCVRCDRPTDGTVCHSEALSLAESLQTAAGHAEDAETVIARQARYGAGGRGGSGEPLPVDLTASARYGTAANTIGRWAQRLLDETNAPEPEAWRPTAGPVCAPRRPADGPPLPGKPWLLCAHRSCEAIRRPRPPAIAEACLWLAGQTGWLRKHPAAGEAFTDLERACADLARLVDRPADKELVGMCDCGKVLYAPGGRIFVSCPQPTCKLLWHVERSRDILHDALRDKLVTAADAARLAAHWDERASEQIRKLVNKWAERSRITAHAELGGDPAFRFGDVLDLLAQTPRRERKVAA